MNLKRKLVYIFVLAFLLNWVWENLHSHFYLHYQGGEITQWILLQSIFADALFITLMAVFFLKSEFLRKNIWYALVLGIIAAIIIEIYALQTGRWEYNELMPIIPIVNTGLTPTVQLGILSYFVYKLVKLKE